MTVQEMAQVVLEVQDAEELEQIARTEEATFQEFASEYVVAALPICKTCHGG